MDERVLDKEEAEALAYANSSPKQARSAPRNVEVPGLYFGYLAAAKKALERYNYLEEQISLQAEIFNKKLKELEIKLMYYEKHEKVEEEFARQFQDILKDIDGE